MCDILCYHSTTTAYWLFGTGVQFSAMPQGQKVIQEVAWIIIRLASILSKDEIATYTGYSLATIKRILLYFEQHGTVQESNRGQEQRKGRLRDVDLEVMLVFIFQFRRRLIFRQILFGSIRKQPDYHLDELQEIMNTTCGVQVSKATVWWTLHKAGFTMKKACFKFATVVDICLCLCRWRELRRNALQRNGWNTAQGLGSMPPTS